MKNETSKVFKQMGARVGIKAERKSQRGIIAKRYLAKMDRFETAEFEKQMVKIDLTKNLVPIRSGGQVIGYL